MMQNPETITRAVELILAARHLERIADHATNIAEDVIYFVKGKTIKHQYRGNTIEELPLELPLSHQQSSKARTFPN